MSDFFIQSKQDIVCVDRIVNGKPETIKINGDSHFPVCDFWSLFKQKIEYETDEQLAFIVLTDEEDFQLDPSITVAKKFITSEADIMDLIFDKLSNSNHLITYPKIKVNVDNLIPCQIAEISSEGAEVEVGTASNSIQNFYRKKTRAIQREANKVKGGK